MDGLLSETTRDVINLVSLGVGLLSFLLALFGHRRQEHPGHIARNTTHQPSSTIQEYINGRPVRNFLFIEVLMLVFGFVFWLPPGTTRTILGSLSLGVLAAQFGCLYQILHRMIESEALDRRGHWLYPVAFIVVILSTSALLSSGVTETPLRSYAFFQLILPAFFSACGLLSYLAYQIMVLAEAYGERNKGSS
jgi:hypothetical protein